MRRVQVTMHSEDGQWWADSTEVGQFTAVASSLAELRVLAREGLSFFLDEPEIELAESIVFEGAPDITYIRRLNRSQKWYVGVTAATVDDPARPTRTNVPARELNPAY